MEPNCDLTTALSMMEFSMRAKQLIKQYHRGILNEEETKQALSVAKDHGEITEVEYNDAMKTFE